MSILSNWLNGDLISAIRDKTNTAINTIGKILVSNTDTGFGYLFDKLIAGAGITITKNNAGGLESITIAGPDISGKLNSSSVILVSNGSATAVFCPAGVDTVVTTLTPSGSKSAVIMKYTFMGYFSSGSMSRGTLKIKQNGTLLTYTKTVVDAAEDMNFCLTFLYSYTAGDIITATVAPDQDSYINYCNLICETFDAI